MDSFGVVEDRHLDGFPTQSLAPTSVGHWASNPSSSQRRHFPDIEMGIRCGGVSRFSDQSIWKFMVKMLSTLGGLSTYIYIRHIYIYMYIHKCMCEFGGGYVLLRYRYTLRTLCIEGTWRHVSLRIDLIPRWGVSHCIQGTRGWFHDFQWEDVEYGSKYLKINLLHDICTFVCLPVYLSIYRSIYLSNLSNLSIYLSISISLYLSIYLYFYLSIYPIFPI